MLVLWAICRESCKTGQTALWLHLACCLVLTADCLCFVCVRETLTAVEHGNWPPSIPSTICSYTQTTIANRMLVQALMVPHLFYFQFLRPEILSAYLNGAFLWSIVSQINPVLSYLTLKYQIPLAQNTMSTKYHKNEITWTRNTISTKYREHKTP